MQNVPKLVAENTLLQRLVTRGAISADELKRIYHELCKVTHPDLSKNDHSLFQKLQQEYEEAKQALEHVQDFFRILQPQEGGLAAETVRIDTLRKGLYDSLEHYTAAGLHSNRIRLNPVLKLRNRLLIQDVLYWAKLYAPEFVTIFIDYNKLFIQDYASWKANELLKRGRRFLLRGFHSCFDFEKNNLKRSFQLACSWLKDAIDIFRLASHSAMARSHLALAVWLLTDLEVYHQVPEGFPERTNRN